MNAPDDTPVGNRAVDLRHRKPVTKVIGKLLAAEHFREPAALILPYLRRIKPCAANFELFHGTAPNRLFAETMLKSPAVHHSDTRPAGLILLSRQLRRLSRA